MIILYFLGVKEFAKLKISSYNINQKDDNYLGHAYVIRSPDPFETHITGID